MSAPAVFLDRDNTLIEDPGYIDDPDKVRLMDDAADAIRGFREAGFRVVVVTNQSGVARGLLTEETLGLIHERLRDLLGRQGASLDAIYACPYLDGPEAVVEQYRRATDLRKPGAGMVLQAAEDLRLDLTQSWMIGDSGRDVDAGRRAGCRTILLDRDGANTNAHQSNPDHVARSLSEAMTYVLRPERKEVAPPVTPAKESGAPEPATGGGAYSRQHLRVLADIRDLLDRNVRRRRQQDFSLLRLVATLMQMLAVVVALWGLVALLSDNPPAATGRFALAIFLQLAALSAFLADRRE